MLHQWTPRTTARAEVALLLRDQHPQAAQAAGLKTSDLDVIITQGQAARQADIEQKEQLATLSVERSERKNIAVDIFDREDALRSRIPAVIGHLQATGQPQLAGFVSTLSFVRYRFRSQPAPKTESPTTTPESESAEATADAEDVKRVARVPRADIPTRAGSLGAFWRALLKPGREPITAELAERGISVDWLEQLAQDSENVERAATQSPTSRRCDSP